MILVSRKYFTLLIIVTAAAFTVIGLYGYSIRGIETVLAPGERQYFAETILFIAVVSAVLGIGTILLIYRRSRRIIRELDKLIELNRYKEYSPQENLRKMGSLGDRINALYAQMNDLNERKSIKISAQSGIIDFLLQNIGLPLVVLDVTGRVTEVSRRYLEIASVEAENTIALPIEKLVPDVKFQEALVRMQQTHGIIENDYGKTHLIFTPVFNRNNEVSNVICVFGREQTFRSPITKPEIPRPEKRSTGSFIRDFFGTGRKQ